MSKAPAFQFYAADYLADEQVQLMSLEEEGAYIRLLAYCWREGSIPADEELLSRLCKCASNQTVRVVTKCFQPLLDDPSRLVNPRLEEERKKQEAWAKKSSEGGKKSAAKRWGTEKKEKDKGGYQMVSDCLQPNGNSSSASSSSNITPLAPKGASDSEKLKSKEIEQQAADIYSAYPLKVGKPAALKAIKRQLVTTPFETLLELTKRYAVSRNGDLSFTPHPATWFNQQRFNDDPITWTHTANSTTARPGPNRNAGNSNANVASQYKLH